MSAQCTLTTVFFAQDFTELYAIYSGGATILTDQQSIAVSTLNQSTVIYPLIHTGPDLSQGREYDFHEPTKYSPAVPIAVTANDFLFKGTASGAVPVLNSERGYGPPLLISESHNVNTA